jgi:hypothetical protein
VYSADYPAIFKNRLPFAMQSRRQKQNQPNRDFGETKLGIAH